MKTHLLVLGCALPLLWLAACTDAGKCTRGEIGCRCTEAQTCAVGGVCREDVCVGVQKPIGDASTTEPDSGPPRPIDCKVDTFVGACTELCRAVCQTEEKVCFDSHCEPNYCEDGGLMTNCQDECGSDVACVQELCELELQRECEDFSYVEKGVNLPGCFSRDPKCVLNPDEGCSDTCGTHNKVGGQLVKNGLCEDGGDSSVSNVCERGTDCTDCHPRVCGKQGASCGNGGDCCGFFSETAYCVDVDRDPDPNAMDPRCLVTCATNQDCDDGYTCSGIKKNTIFVC